jgi:hypothetical protein
MDFTHASSSVISGLTFCARHTDCNCLMRGAAVDTLLAGRDVRPHCCGRAVRCMLRVCIAIGVKHTL